MHFGSLQIVTAWRLTRGDAACQAIIMDGQEGFRFVVIEDQRIVSWDRVATIQDLRRRVSDTRKARYASGWLPPAAVGIAADRKASKVAPLRDGASRLFAIL